MSVSLKKTLPWAAGVFVLSGLLILLDRRELSFVGWLAYAILCAVCAILIALFWKWFVGRDSPRWLRTAFVVALVLRLFVGIGLFHALPVFGYDETPQRAGYVFLDAYNRDVDSFQLARSDQSLFTAFTQLSGKDQYGGLKFLSALIYRILTPTIRRPLLIGLLSATVSALAVLLTWGFVSLMFGSTAALLATWVIALFPDAVLLGASQMREPFIILALALALYGYAKIRRGRLNVGLMIIILGALFILPISPPFALGILGIVGLIWLWEDREGMFRSRWLLLGFIGIALVAIVLVVRSWSTIGDLAGSGLDVLIAWWKSLGASWHLREIWTQSDWTRHFLRSSPEWAQFPLIVLYGVFRPFLPGALIDSGAPIWRIIAIWRGLGWFALLPFLLYAPLVAIRQTGWRGLPTVLSVLVWGSTLLASYRGAGDQWDNPRYRAAFIVLQAALVGWAWVNARETRNPWLQRIVLIVGLVTALFTLWYAYRSRLLPYFTPLHAMGSIAGIALLTLLLFLVLDFWRTRRVGP